jgi:small subunit ribosomal protein S17
MEKKNNTRILRGTVVSDKMDKTRVVEIVRLVQHPRYKKIYRSSTRVKAHDEQNQYHIGDKVVVEESRPLSRDKRWHIVGLVEKAQVLPTIPDEKEEKQQEQETVEE